MPNRLINEQSPYLQQHGNNPVDWYPWGDEAFERAKKENKPVIVSIGYAACHWCHVMEHESFENVDTAAFMNEHFINIKVDREEHPDVDHMYMDAVQAISQSGGWPLNVFVTPERVPFYGGTYYPPKPLYGRPSWVQVMQQINDVWTKHNDEVAAQSEQMLKYLQQLSFVAMKNEQQWNADACRKAADNVLSTADATHGGFGGAPKFPAAMSIIYLLEHYHFTGYEPALKHALKSLDAMAEGGIYDQLVGGFARYSTDVRWLTPHFEKMLYDNALLVMAYAEAYRVTKEEKYKQVVRETIDFVNSELQSPEGGFYCALDADSEGEEGKFYTFTWQEWMEITGGNPLVERYFGVTEKGNWEGTNILHEAISIPMLAKENNTDEADITRQINEVKKTLLKARQQRIRPATDDKCLLSWNAMMNMALSRAGALLENESYIEQAQQHMQWMVQSYNTKGTLMHTWKDGVARIDAKLDDFAWLTASMLQLASVSGDNSLVLAANELMKTTEEGFLHENKSFFYFSSVHQKDIPVRKTDLYDGSVPSANSIMASNLVLLGMLMERSDWLEQGQYILRQMQESACRYPTSYASWAICGQKMAAGFKTVVLAGVSADETVRQLRKIHYPGAYFFVAGDAANDVPLLAGKYSTGAVKVHICDTESCKLPTEDMSFVTEMLKNKL